MSETMLTIESLETVGRSEGADFFGVAELEPARDAIGEQGREFVAAFPRAVSVGVRLMNEIIDQLPNRDQPAVAMTFRQQAYDVVNLRLDQITSRIASTLQNEGARALPIPASQTVDVENHMGIFSHKMAARLAGLGWIGKNCLLITPEVGPRVRWATVLTDAPLASSGPLMEDGCGTCTDCVDACPASALTGESFRPEDPREVRFAADDCLDYQKEMEEKVGVRVCGMCVYACPYGRGVATAASA